MWRVAGSDVCKDSYHEIRDHWTVCELVEALRHDTYQRARIAYEREKASNETP